MGKAERIARGIYLVAGQGLTDPDDAASFLLLFGDEALLIDAGAGSSVSQILENVRATGAKPAEIRFLILTHCHIDHSGGAAEIKRRTGCHVIAHQRDADAIETGDATKTAAGWYGRSLSPVTVDHRLQGLSEGYVFGEEVLYCLHTPGHTPGSLSVYLDRDGKRILFGQDIHGPFHPAFESDVSLWRRSMLGLLDLEADILCEGHFGIFTGKDEVRDYIAGYLSQYADSPL